MHFKSTLGVNHLLHKYPKDLKKYSCIPQERKIQRLVFRVHTYTLFFRKMGSLNKQIVSICNQIKSLARFYIFFKKQGIKSLQLKIY